MAGLNSGVRRTVAWLNERGFRTCDSGDGETHDHECDRDYAYVVVRIDAPDSIAHAADRLARALREAGVNVCAMQEERAEGEVNIQAMYDPCDGFATIDVQGLCDRVLFPGDDDTADPTARELRDEARAALLLTCAVMVSLDHSHPLAQATMHAVRGKLAAFGLIVPTYPLTMTDSARAVLAWMEARDAER